MAKILDFLQSSGMVNVLLAVLVIVLVYLYMKGSLFESLENISEEIQMAPVQQDQQIEQQPSLALGNGLEPQPEQPVVVDEQQKQIDRVVAGTTQLGAEDLLPKYDDANEFAKENPVSKLLKEQNWLFKIIK